MPYSTQTVRRARQILAQRKADRESEYREHLQNAYQQLPRLKEIDAQLRRSMAIAAQTAFSKGEDVQKEMDAIKTANLALQQERQALIVQNFSENYLDESPICPHCSGSGYMGTSMCRCLSQLCRQVQKEELSLLTTGKERFENFRLDVYSDRTDPRYKASPRAIMERNFQLCRRYADGFMPGCGSLLFVGGTGLGKTFLSACIADVVTDKEYSVAYESAPHLFAKLEKNRFSPDEQSREEVSRIENCDLLIVDDLGTEMPGNFVTAALYGLVNDRLLAKKNMIISTNLNVEELAKRYSPQIASRLQGSFRGLTFVGEDVRIRRI